MTFHTRPTVDGAFTISPWGADGVATVEATGGDRRAVLEAGLQAILALVLPTSAMPEESDNTRSMPIRGEGNDLAALFADIADDFLEQIAELGSALHDVSVDGVLRGDRDVLVAWGYAMATVGSRRGLAFTITESPVAIERESAPIVLRASLRREPVAG